MASIDNRSFGPTVLAVLLVATLTPTWVSADGAGTILIFPHLQVSDSSGVERGVTEAPRDVDPGLDVFATYTKGTLVILGEYFLD